MAAAVDVALIAILIRQGSLELDIVLWNVNVVVKVGALILLKMKR